MGLWEDLKKFFSDSEKKVRIRNSLYESLLAEVGMDDQQVELLVNKILYDRQDELQRTAQKEIENSIREEKLLEACNILDKVLFSTLSRNIKIGITNRLVGKEDSDDNYLLKDYKLSFPRNYLELILEKDGKEYPILFEKILEINHSLLGNNDELKVWIYMPQDTWRFYLRFDQEQIKRSGDSGRYDDGKNNK